MPVSPKDFIVYVDFDRTLFDTVRFRDAQCQAIATAAGLPEERVNADLKNFMADKRLGGYDYEAHIRSYGLDPDTMWHEVERICQSQDFLFPESPAFIQSLRSEGFNPKILSFGEERYQHIKIEPTLPKLLGGEVNPAQALEFDVVFRKKGEHIADLHAGQKGVLVDDVPEQELPDGFTEIHIDHNIMLTLPERTSEGYKVSDLDQALEIIRLIASEK